jgi:hypothetical protein
MQVFPSKQGYALRLERGEEIHAALGAWAAETGLHGAFVTGLGAVEDVELGFYDLERRVYERRVVRGRFEILSLTGNLSLREGKPFLHAHVALSRDDFTVTGGHLFRAVVTATVEIAVTHADLRLSREPDEDIGLPLLERIEP